MSFDPQAILNLDGYLKPELPAIAARYAAFSKWKDTIHQSEGGLDQFSKGFLKYGFNITPAGDIVYREWAPNAHQACLIGDFSKCAWTPFMLN
jgi:1,4-alpha-glucan branching enzyme